ncbi:MAG TPA: glutamate synthase subunit beta [Sphingobacteriaceae bacterium]|nr:glutamate synthase subunit beta [Sphingobacteriaceae bacterium]
MGKITGFKEYTRELPKKTDPDKRVQNYSEFVGLYNNTKLNEQSARCMNCGIPFCHSGCPLGNVIPEFNDAVYNAKWDEAYEILSSTNNFPEFTGRICPAPCEAACVLGINRPPVAIEEIEKHIIEIAFAKGFVKASQPVLRTGKKIAVVGSGPAGMAAAVQLNKAGHLVTIFERDDLPGGLLRYGIPDFKLEKSVIDRRIAIMEEEGIIFKCNCEVGKDIDAKDLLEQFDALILSGGSTVPRDLPIPGRNLKGVHFAMEFLKQQNKIVSNISYLDDPVLATEKDVIVIGGGDTGSDCVGTSNRQWANSIKQFEFLPHPPVGRTDAMPWPTYPMVLKTTSSHEEGCERLWSVNTKAFIGDENGCLKAIKVTDVMWETDTYGRPVKPIILEETEREIPAQLVLLAMGFVNPQYNGMLEQLGVTLDERGNVKASEEEFSTSVEKVFAAGDMRRGQSLVVWAISEGREAARKVDEYLMGYTALPSKDALSFVNS